MRVIPLLVVLAATGAGAQQRAPQPIAAGTSTIRGRVIDELTNQGVAGCIVGLSSYSPVGGARATTSDDGAFAFENIVEGSFSLLATCPSHATTCSRPTNADPVPCSPVAVVRDQTLTTEIRVAPGAIARGRVVDMNGRAVAGATVRLGNSSNDAPPRLALVLPNATTKDGRFELRNLVAGEWLLEVELPVAAGSLRPPLMYFPGVTSQDDARAIKVTAGQELDGLTIVVPALADNRLTIRVPPPDATISDVAVAIIRPDPLVVNRLAVDADGVGSLGGLLQGRFFAVATARSSGHSWATFEVVDYLDGTYELPLQLQLVGRIAGRIVAQKGILPELSGASVSAAWVYDDVEVNPLSPTMVNVTPDGSFHIDGMFGRRRLELLGLNSQWKVVSISQGRTDVTASGVDVPPDTTVEITIVVAPQ